MRLFWVISVHFGFGVPRCAEFGRVCVDFTLDATKPNVNYCAIVLPENFKKLSEALQSKVYNHWDVSDKSPPKERPREAAAENHMSNLQLEILAINREVSTLARCDHEQVQPGLRGA